MQTHLLTKAAALRSFVASIGFTALLGLWALLAGNFGELQGRVLLSSLSVSAASLCAMAGALAAERTGPPNQLAAGAVVLSPIGLLLVLVGIWAEPSSSAYWKLTGVTCFFAAGCAHAAVLRLARLTPSSEWVQKATALLVLALAAGSSLLLVAESSSEISLRILGALSILVAAGTVATPVLHRLSREELRATEAIGDHTEALVSMLCPACGTHLNAPLGSVQCRECQARFRIELDEPGTTAPRIGDRERSSPAIQPKPGT